MKQRAWQALVVAGVTAALPRASAACDMCIAAQDENVQAAFIVASLGMTALPLTLIGGGVWWLWRRATRIAAEEEAGVIRLPTANVRPRRSA